MPCEPGHASEVIPTTQPANRKNTMAHALTERADGTVEFAYHVDHGQGWHGLGQAVQADDARSIPAWAQAAGMDW